MWIMGQDLGPNGAVGVVVWFVSQSTSGFDEGGIGVGMEKEDEEGFVRACLEEVLGHGDVTELGLSSGKVSLELPKDSFSLPSVLSIGVDFSTCIIEGLDPCSRPKMFKEFPK
jgi:hypothetical protein